MTQANKKIVKPEKDDFNISRTLDVDKEILKQQAIKDEKQKKKKQEK